MATLHLKIVTPEKLIFEEDVDSVLVPSAEGELGILPHHTNLMAKLSPGELKIKKSGKIESLASGGGFLEMSNNTLTILTDLAVKEGDIDEKAVEAAKKRAEEALEEKLSAEEYAATLAIIEKATAQLRIKRRHRVR